MSLVRLEKVTKRFQTEAILDEVDFRIEEGEKIGLIGRNGSGKSTLFRLITGEHEPDSGLVERMRRARMACLAQLPDVPSDKTIHEVVLDVFTELREMETRLRELEERMANGDESAIEPYGELQDGFSIRGGYEYHANIKRVLCGLGFTEEDFQLPFKVLSGGQRTRLMLALVLLQDADLLLLDEPENHLDLQAREWLEDFLKDWQRAFVIISHDREMLNAVAERIVEVELRQVRNYPGNYEAYQKAKALYREQHEVAYRRQQELIQKEESRINRFRYKSTKAKQVQSWIKQLDKLERVEAPPTELDTARFGLGEVIRSSQFVLEAKELSMSYGDLALYSDVTFNVERGERVGIIGPNGAGKTTLLRQLDGRLDGATGEVRVGHKVKCGWYDQQHEDLTSNREVIEEMERAFPTYGREAMRSFMGRFLFTGNDVFKKVSELSGGERSRMAMAKLILSEANLLFLDEPTNHLDIASREALEAALLDFPGTIVMVSHDRALIDKMADKLIIVADGKAEVFLGNYSHYKWKVKGVDRTLEAGADVMRVRKEGKANGSSGKKGADPTDKERKAAKRKLKKIEERIEEIEELIAEIDQRFQKVEPSDFQALEELSNEKQGLEADLKEVYAEWESVSEVAGEV